MKKKALLAMLLIACSITVAACAQQDETAETTAATTESETVAATETETDTEPATETETETVPETESETETETVPETETFDEAQTHAGTDILYEAPADSPNANICVVVDAGHQAKSNADKEANGPGSTTLKAKMTQGATGQFTGQFEKDLNLAVSLYLRNELVKRGYNVVMIRETNEVDCSNVQRAQITNAYKDKYEKVISIHIHANSFSKETAKGALVMCQKPNSVYPACAALYGESLRLSNAIIDPFCSVTGMSKRSMLESDTMTGLNWSEVPTTYLEMGFLSNEADDRLMLTDEFRRNAAKGVADGVDAYFAS